MTSDDPSGHYPSREAMRARVAASDPVPDEAATALDSVRFSDDLLAEWATAEPAPRDETEAEALEPAGALPEPEPASLGRERVMSRATWMAMFAMAVVGGLLGALFGIWLAFR